MPIFPRPSGGFRATVLREIHFDTLYDGQPSFADIHDHLTKSGFSYGGALQQVYGPNGRTVFADEPFTRQDLRTPPPDTRS